MEAGVGAQGKELLLTGGDEAADFVEEVEDEGEVGA